MEDASKIPTLLMGPILIVMYVGRARREDEELAARFGEVFRGYAAWTPAFVPSWRGARPAPRVHAVSAATLAPRPTGEDPGRAGSP